MTTPAVGDTIEVYWPDDDEYYAGKVAAYFARTGTYTIHYYDDEVEDLDLAREKWRTLNKRCFEKSRRKSDKPRTCVSLPRTPSLNLPENVGTCPPTHNSAQLQHKLNPEMYTSRSPVTVTETPSAVVTLPSVSRRSSSKPTRLPSKRNAASQPTRTSKRLRKQLEIASPSSIQCEPKDIVVSKISQTRSFLSSTSVQLIECCVDSWLRKEIRRQFNMFSIQQCLDHATNMLASAAVNPSYLAKLENKSTKNARWIDSGLVEDSRRRSYDKWDRPHSDAEWRSEKSMLARILDLVREAVESECNGEEDGNAAVEGMRYLFHARYQSRLRT